MTDNEIIKALELEATPMERNCVHTIYEEACGLWCTKKHKQAENCMECEEHTMGYYGRYAKATLDLINRQKAEIENYKKVAENQQKVTIDRGFEIKKLKAEIKRLKREVEDLESTQEISPEAKYLVDTKADKVISLLTELNKSQEQIKAEAYKEFAERLKKELFYKCGDINYSETCDTRKLIDNLLKELVGDCGQSG